MATFKYVGTPPQNDVRPTVGQDLVPQSLVTRLLSGNMLSSAVTAQINALLVGYATTSQATSAMAGLATPSWIQSQAVPYALAASAGHPNGPVPLEPDSGLVPVGQINAASTQTWPLPFWSPSAYQPSPINATTDPVQLYTVQVPDPGWPYVLLCTGMIDTQVGADDGTFAQILVREGGPTGQVIAFGYGVGESYLGPAPGELLSQAFTNSSATATGGWATVTSMLGNNNSGYSSTMVGNYLQVSQNMAMGTIIASFSYSGASGATGTQVRLITNTGTVVATGKAIADDDGTVTATFTGPLAAGALYGVQLRETGPPDTFATFSNGTLTIQPSQQGSTGMANVIPVSFHNQLPIAGATNLSVMLQSSNNSTQVTAGTFDPALWVMPIPWGGGASLPTVTFDAAGVGTQGTNTNFSFAHVAAAGAYLIVDIVVDRTSAVTTISYGTQKMTLLRLASFPSSIISGSSAVVFRYGVSNVTGGTANVTFSLSVRANVTASSVSYLNVAQVTSSSTSATNTTPQLALTCGTGQVIVASLATSSGPLTTPTGGTVRYNTGGANSQLCIQDATAAETFGAVLTTSQAWAAIGTVLVG